jgi:hypothetical protein
MSPRVLIVLHIDSTIKGMTDEVWLILALSTFRGGAIASDRNWQKLAGSARNSLNTGAWPLRVCALDARGAKVCQY